MSTISTFSETNTTSPLIPLLQVIQNGDARAKITNLLENLFKERCAALTIESSHVTVKLLAAYEKPIPKATLRLPEELRFLILESGGISFDLPEFSPWLDVQNNRTLYCDSIRLEQNNYRFLCVYKDENSSGFVPIAINIDTFLSQSSN